jgi:hypothetical protein
MLNLGQNFRWCFNHRKFDQRRWKKLLAGYIDPITFFDRDSDNFFPEVSRKKFGSFRFLHEIFPCQFKKE